MVTTASRLIHRATHTLQSRLVLFTAIMLIISCSALSGYFVAHQITSSTDALLQNGRVLASQLAATTQYSVYVKDSRRIQELISGALALDDVAYIFVVSRDNRILGAVGKHEWKSLTGSRVESDWLPILAAQRAEALHQTEPLTTLNRTIRIVDGHPLMESSFLSSTQRWAAVLLGSDRPLFYDIIVPIRNTGASIDLDPALGLTLDERPSGAASSTDLSASLAGLVQVGFTDRQHQFLLRQLVWQIAILTTAILAIGIGIVAYISRRMTQPLNELITVARQVASGDLSASVASRSSDEIGELAKVFNQMTTSLQSREADLVESTRTLEIKVGERTHELQEANTRLQELDRLKTSLVSNASHELRTPLTSIKVHVRNLLDGVTGALGSDQIESLDRVHTNVERLRTLIDDLLDLSRLQTGLGDIKQEEVSLKDLVNEVLQSLRFFSEQKHLSMTAAFPTPFPLISADREKLLRILTNLIHNSIKFTSEGGRVHIEGHQHSAEAITVVVEDSGCGIAPEELSKVFLPFYRSTAHVTQFRGSGLGLSITKELIELHHGTIWVESLVGKGSRFHVRLPIALPQPAVVAT
jgi:two-component system sensor histidine kinase BarA